jgi:hypothetical protein
MNQYSTKANVRKQVFSVLKMPYLQIKQRIFCNPLPTPVPSFFPFVVKCIFIVVFLFSSCKKEDKRTDVTNTQYGKESEFISFLLEKSGTNTISIFSVPVFAFKHPVGKEFTSPEGDKMIYSISEQTVKDLAGKDIAGTWSFNSTNDTLSFIPNEIFNDHSDLTIKLRISLHYADEVDKGITGYPSGVKKYEFQQNFITKEQLITEATPSSSDQLSPLSKTFDFAISQKLNEQVNAFNRVLKFEMDKLTVIDTVSKSEIKVTTETIGTHVKVTASDILPSNAVIKFKLNVRVSELKNGAWQQLKKQNQDFNYVDSISYKTQILNLNLQSIEYCYPVDRQYNFLKKEYPTGYVKLKAPFMLANEPGYTCIARFNQVQGDSMDVDLTYNRDSNYFSFPLPQTLENKKIYNLRFIANSNSSSVVFYNIYFRTSGFDKFEDKWSKAVLCKLAREEKSSLNQYILREVFDTIEEYFDFFENSNIKLRALLDKTRGWANSGFYEEMRKHGYKITWRTENPMGVPPQYAVFFSNDKGKKLTDEMIFSNNAPDLVNPVSIAYMPIWCFNLDFLDVKSQIANHDFHYSLDSWEKSILDYSTVGYYLNVLYYFEVKYTLPGGIVTFTSEGSLVL